jgi:translation initiation factor IF-3
MPTRDALQMAFEAGLDLVEVAPTADPPVCRICDYGKLKFEKSKAKKVSIKNSKQAEMKEIQVSPVIGDHDLITKINAVKKFLMEGRTVQVTCIFSKRQIMFKDQGFKVMEKITEAVNEVGTLERQPAFTDKRLQTRYKPAKES